MQNPGLKKISSSLLLFGTFLLAIALPWSAFLMSNAAILLFVAWLAGGDLPDKLKVFSKNKAALALSAVFILHIIGLSYTTDFTFGINDLRTKIPLMLLPLVFSTSPPLSEKIMNRLLAIFSLSILTATFFSFYVLLGYSKKEILQPQDASIFISHIRFSLMISLSVFFWIHFISLTKNIFLKMLFLLIVVWLVLFMMMLEAETGLISTAVVMFVLLLRKFFSIRDRTVKILAAVSLLIVSFFAGTFVMNVISEKRIARDSNPLPLTTKKGNLYSNDASNPEEENGNKVWVTVCEQELQEEWNQKSGLPYSGKDLKGNEIKYTLIRFLASKGATKDAEGVQALSVEEIAAIEKGIPNSDYMRILNPRARIKKIAWEFEKYFRGGNPSGHSVVQRLEYWKAATGIIKENFLFGVGTGDPMIAFKDHYEKTLSPLTLPWRLRSHNQFLAIGVSLGIVGMTVFLFSLFYPILSEKKYKEYLYLSFFIIALLSFLGEDTLETQAGVTFFAFFNSLLLFACKKEARSVS